MNLTICNGCGRDGIVWAYRSSYSDSAYPLELGAPVLVLAKTGQAHKTHGFQEHHCLEADKKNWEPLTREDWEWVNEVRREDVNASAELYPCPKCGAAAEEGCWNLAERGRGRDVHTAWPHAERFESAP